MSGYSLQGKLSYVALTAEIQIDICVANLFCRGYTEKSKLLLFDTSSLNQNWLLVN